MPHAFITTTKWTVTAIFLLLPAILVAQRKETTAAHSFETAWFQNKDGAIRGYDPVAYFSANTPQKGDTAFSFKWGGANWYFQNGANKEAFMASPEKFAPQYGGYCAYGVSENHRSPTDPMAFTIVDGKLYLNYNNKVKELWLKDKEGRIPKANGFWPGLSSGQ